MRSLAPFAFALGLLLAQAPAPVTQLTATADCPSQSSITTYITGQASPSDTLTFVCASLPPSLQCPSSVTIPRGYSVYGAGVVQVRLSWTGVPILAMPGLTSITGPLSCPTCAWSNNLNPAPGDWFVAQAQIDTATGTFAAVQQLWSGWPALPQVSVVCQTSCSQITVSNTPGQVTVNAP